MIVQLGVKVEQGCRTPLLDAKRRNLSYTRLLMDEISSPRPVGCPTLESHEAKAKIIPVRFNAQDIKKIEASAKGKGQTLSQWIRETLTETMNG